LQTGWNMSLLNGWVVFGVFYLKCAKMFTTK